MYPARIPFRFWLVGMAVVFFIAGVFFRVSAASETINAADRPAFGSVLLLSLIAFTMTASALCLVSFYQRHHSASWKKLHKIK